MITILVTIAATLAACASGAPTSNIPDTKARIPCTDPRPQMCTMDYQPVCGHLKSDEFKTYSNGCNACSEPTVNGYSKGVCK